jgi:dihydroorotate dehydrogenase electron transfer subunit
MHHMTSHRDTIFLETATVIEQRQFPGDQFILKMRAPACAAAAKPGSFAHITCDPMTPMRRPLSIMSADASEGSVEFLYKVVGGGLRALTHYQPGDELSLLGPIGVPFSPHPDRPNLLAIGGGVGIPPMVFLANSLPAAFNPLVIMGSEIPFPFELAQSQRQLAGLPDTTHGVMANLEKLGIATRLASNAEYPEAFRGFVTDLARQHLAALDPEQLAATQIAACGPTPMLKAVAAVAREFSLPCQVALEEFMACGVGGCAGCTVLVETPTGQAMKRVCVDGPVFDAHKVVGF